VRDRDVHHGHGEALALVAHPQDLAVAHVPEGAVDVAQRRDPQPDRLDGAAGLPDVDDVADAVLVLQEHEHPGEEVLDEVLRAEADRDADDARRREDRRQINAELTQHHDRGDDPDHGGAQRPQHRTQRASALAAPVGRGRGGAAVHQLRDRVARGSRDHPVDQAVQQPARDQGEEQDEEDP